MNEIPNLATPNDVLEHIPFQNANGEIEIGAVPRVNELEMPIIDKVGVSRPGKFIIVNVPQTGYYVAENGLMVPFDVIAEALGVDPSVFEAGPRTINITGKGFDRFCYVEHNGVQYTGGSFEANDGDTIKLYANFGPKNHITYNGQMVANGGPCSFEFIVDNAYNINLEYSPASHAYITATEA